MANTPKYPSVVVELTGSDGNALSIVGKVARALKSHGIKEPEVAKFREEALSGDYDNVLQTAMKWVDVE